ncbi:MAG: DNA polymerase ligase N-terminal domain-containing protein [Fimbriiglobus sp.]
MRRFVILTHDWPSKHWDLLLEVGPVCKAWRLLAEPLPKAIVRAEPIDDHRLFYLDYEGPVAGDRGIVEVWDRGLYEGTEITSEFVVDWIGQRYKGTAYMLPSKDGGFVFALSSHSPSSTTFTERLARDDQSPDVTFV